MNHRLKRIRTFLCCLFHVKGYRWYAPWMYDQLRRLNGMEEEMENAEIVIWLQSLKSEIGKQSNQHLWNYEEALDIAIKALQEDEWIPVSEALPSEGQVVLAIGDKGTWDVGKFQGTAGWTDDERMWSWKHKSTKRVEYWMPKDAIPLPNRGEEE